MKRLVTFGCSLTQGQHLEKDNEHSKLAWPFLLGQKLNLPVINKGRNGSSVKRIWWDIVNFNFDKSDIVVILWTHFDRWCVINEPGSKDWNKNPSHSIDWDIPFEFSKQDYDNYDEATNIHHRSINGQSKAWYRYFHKEYDMTQNAYLHINHADFYLKNKVKHVFHLKASQPDRVADFNETSFLKTDIDKMRYHFPPALDNLHPGIEFQEEYASKIKEEIETYI